MRNPAGRRAAQARRALASGTGGTAFGACPNRPRRSGNVCGPSDTSRSTTSANELPAPNQEFIQAASMSSSTEIDAAKLVETRSQDKDVKRFARRMAVDHTKLTAQLKMRHRAA